MRTVLLGAYGGGVQAFNTLVGRSEMVLVVTPDSKSGEQLSTVARKRGIQVYRGPFGKDPAFRDEILTRGVDLLVNVLSPYLVCPELLEAPRIGSFNLHPSLLPKFGGRNPTAWAIYRGEKEHGATLHWMAPEIDCGPVALQRSFPIANNHTPVSLLRDSVRLGMSLIEELLEISAHAPHEIPRIPQDPSKREYFGKESPENGWLTWDRAARDVVNFVRAFDYSPIECPWGKVRAEINQRAVSITKASPSGEPCTGVAPGTVSDNQARVATLDEWVNVTFSWQPAL